MSSFRPIARPTLPARTSGSPTSSSATSPCLSRDASTRDVTGTGQAPALLIPAYAYRMHRMSLTKESTVNITTINPATEEQLGPIQVDSPEVVDRKLQSGPRCLPDLAADADRGTCRQGSQHRRASCGQTSDKLAPLMTAEMGKTIAEAEGRSREERWQLRLLRRQRTRRCSKPRSSRQPPARVYVSFEPLGVILAVMPWNYPIWQLMRHAAPALVAGNTIVLKHASNVTGCCARPPGGRSRSRTARGLPPNAGHSRQRVEDVIADPRVAAVTLTGSDAVGSKVAETAGRHIKKTVLELGGSDAFVVLEDADLEKASQFAARSRFQNAGQVCISAKRFIVVDNVADQFRRAVQAEGRGDPLRRSNQPRYENGSDGPGRPPRRNRAPTGRNTRVRRRPGHRRRRARRARAITSRRRSSTTSQPT